MCLQQRGYGAEDRRPALRRQHPGLGGRERGEEKESFKHPLEYVDVMGGLSCEIAAGWGEKMTQHECQIRLSRNVAGEPDRQKYSN